MKNLRYKMQKSYIITVVHILLLEKSIKGEVHMESLKERLLQEQYRLEQILKKTQEQLKNAPQGLLYLSKVKKMDAILSLFSWQNKTKAVYSQI